jgi:hypothetical protein
MKRISNLHTHASPPLSPDFDPREIDPDVIRAYDFVAKPFRQRLPILLLLSVCLALYNRSAAQHELIDGPANVRSDPENGKVIFTLNDSVPVWTADSTEKMYMVALPIRITAAQGKNFAIEKNVPLYAGDGTIIGKTVGYAKLMDIYKKGDQLMGVLYGYTAVQNIRSTTLPENMLSMLLARDSVISEAHCKYLIQALQISPSVMGSFRVYLIEGGLVYGPGNLTRLMLAFDKGILFAVVHLRLLPYMGGERLDLNRGYFMTVIGRQDRERVSSFVVEANKFIEKENRQ